MSRSMKRFVNFYHLFIFVLTYVYFSSLMLSSENMHNLLQNLHSKIKFTIEHSSKELPFLDILIKNVNDHILTDIYHKPTDT